MYQIHYIIRNLRICWISKVQIESKGFMLLGWVAPVVGVEPVVIIGSP